ncbi:hypothetical protein C8F01DRAFT_973601 [Mycena amicta]|nr:hypothetical protein C8F01DRAFT_973601 [Mycena amicta]
MDASPAKRARTDDGEMIRSDIWHNDGSVVLQARTMQFRVHWSILSMHSSVFKDMHGVPQPDASEPMVEGCPVVELHDDPKDVENILRVLYNPTLLLKPKISFELVAALVRLGRKYDFQDLWSAGVERLTYELPATLAQFDARFKDGSKMTRIHYYRGIRLDMIDLAGQNNIRTVLPCAYLLTVASPKESWLDEITKADGTVVSLAPLDLRRCISGVDKIVKMQFQPGYALCWLVKMPNDCVTPRDCAEKRMGVLTTFVGSVQGLLLPSSTMDRFANRTCEPCQQHIRGLFSGSREKAWNDLPSVFGLPAWSELKNEI